MKFCTECGKQLDSEDVFCGGCGTATTLQQNEAVTEVIADHVESSCDSSKQFAVSESERDWLEIAKSYYFDDEHDLALPAVKKAQQQWPGNKATWFLTADIYLQLKEYSLADEAAREAILLDDKDYYGYYLSGYALYMKDEYEKAERQFVRARKYALNEESPEEAFARIDKIMTALSIEKSNDAGNQELAQIYDSFFEVYRSVPQEFYYNRDIMNYLHGVQVQLKQIVTEFNGMYGSLPNPCSATTQTYRNAAQEMEAAILDVQGAIDRGNRLVWNWGRIFVSFMIGLPPFFIGMLHPNIHFLIVVGLAIIGFGLLFSVKPVYKFGR